jgi:hypothetical protein
MNYLLCIHILFIYFYRSTTKFKVLLERLDGLQQGTKDLSLNNPFRTQDFIEEAVQTQDFPRTEKLE